MHARPLPQKPGFLRRGLLAALPLAAALLALGACSQVASLDGVAKAKPLPTREQALVREQVAKARAAQEWTAAWDQEVAAGADRATLEAIALEALADESGSAEGMFAELRKSGGLSEATRRGVAAQVQAAEAARRWTRAVEICILTAEDPPEYANAWALYRRVPANKAPDVLQEIRDAKDEWAKEQAEGKTGDGAPGAAGSPPSGAGR